MTAQVVTFIGESRRERVVFDGNEEDARTYLEQHFPRLHVEPGSPDEPAPDAVLVSETGTRSFYDGREWADYEPPNASNTRTPQRDDRDDEIDRLRAELAAREEADPAPPVQLEPTAE